MRLNGNVRDNFIFAEPLSGIFFSVKLLQISESMKGHVAPKRSSVCHVRKTKPNLQRKNKKTTATKNLCNRNLYIILAVTERDCLLP